MSSAWPKWPKPLALGFLLACGAANAATGQFFFQPFFHTWRYELPPNDDDVPRYASRRAVAQILANAGYELVGPLGRRGEQIVATGLSRRDGGMRFYIDPSKANSSTPCASPQRRLMHGSGAKTSRCRRAGAGHAKRRPRPRRLAAQGRPRALQPNTPWPNRQGRPRRNHGRITPRRQRWRRPSLRSPGRMRQPSWTPSQISSQAPSRTTSPPPRRPRRPLPCAPSPRARRASRIGRSFPRSPRKERRR